MKEEPAGEILDRALAFVLDCREPGGGYRASPDPDYPGHSDTGLSDLAAVTYAAVLARTFDRQLPGPGESVSYIRTRQQSDGSFQHARGAMDPSSDLAILYDTTQAMVALRALGTAPDHDPEGPIALLLERDRYRRLPWYTTSFFPLFYLASGRPFPPEHRNALASWMAESQTADGYLGNHVAATFHLAHFYRLLGEPVPRASQMVDRVLAEQQPDGGWRRFPPDWDVHACFDACFILRQLGGQRPKCRSALGRAADWARSCQNPDGGFGHYPGWHSDLDATYFQLGALVMAGTLSVACSTDDGRILGWGHAMLPAIGRE